MWPFGKKTARQKEIRRSKAERLPVWYLQIAERIHLQPLILLLTCAVAAAVIVNTGDDVLELREGQYLPRALTSRVAFRIKDEARTQVERMRARDNAEDYYALDTSLLTDIRGRLASALRIAREQGADAQKLRESATAIKIMLDEQGLAALVEIAAQADAASYERAIDRAILGLRRQNLVEAEEQAPRRTGLNAVLVDPEQSTERRVSINRLLFSNAEDNVSTVIAAAADEFPPALRPSMKTSLLEMLRGEREGTFKPLYRYDTAASAKAAREAEESVEPQYVVYAVGSRLADAGILTRDALDLLREEHRQYLAARDAEPVLRAADQRAVLARGLMSFLVVFGLGGYILAWHAGSPRAARPRAITALALVLTLILARAAYLHTPTPYVAIGAFAFAVALLAITSRRTAGQAAAALLGLMITVASRQGVGCMIVLAAVAVVLLVGLRDVRNRGRIIAVGGLAALVALGLTLLVGLVNEQTLTFLLWNHALWAAVTTLGAAFIVEGILPGIERLFGVTTNMTLLEWCDPNKPLLRMLAAESPGTYNHALLVGALADAAANAIGANGLLARAGAYYHDIGKINKPEYFIENQGLGVGNRHERLSPAMSHLIIIGHVKDGIEMAKAYAVPVSLHAFIPEHHGTCVVEYFYHAASMARRPGDPEVSESQFRYPGPKPQSRETAIVMMSDGVEGAVRAMTEPTPNRIEDTVDRIIQKRLVDGQFDECDLTFRELATIRDSLVKSLISIYHGRIKYPSAEGEAQARSAS